MYARALLHSKYSNGADQQQNYLLTFTLYLTVIQDWASLQEGVIHPV